MNTGLHVYRVVRNEKGVDRQNTRNCKASRVQGAKHTNVLGGTRGTQGRLEGRTCTTREKDVPQKTSRVTAA